MKAVIEYSTISKKYYFFPEPKNRGLVIGRTRKDEIERVAREHGATEIVHKTLSASQLLRKIGFAADSARELSREFYRDGRRK